MLGSIEFYIIMAVVAASIVAVASRPRGRREMREYLVGSTLVGGDDNDGTGLNVGLDGGPQIEMRCNPDGTVRLTRRGLTGVTMSGAVSIAARCNGVDLVIEERLVEGLPGEAEASEAVFVLDFLPQGWYHVRYNSDRTGLFAAFQLHVRPGLVATRMLNH